MRKKYRDLKRKGNVIVFPTTVNRLLSDGMAYLKEEKYIEAREALHQVLSYEPDNAAALGAYSYCLFELAEFDEALDVCKELLNIGPLHYLETMELYISILMQLRQYDEAEGVIEALIEEGVLPEERLDQYRQLRELNERIAANATSEKVDSELYDLEPFLALSPMEQERRIMDLPPESFGPLKKKLLAIVEHDDSDMLTKTYILFILHQEKISGTVQVGKFQFNADFDISKLPDPVQSERLQSIKKYIEEALSKDPTRLEMVLELFDRHTYLLYPFQWPGIDGREVAEAYMSFVDMLFTGDTSIPGNDELIALIIGAEEWFEQRNG